MKIQTLATTGARLLVLFAVAVIHNPSVTASQLDRAGSRPRSVAIVPGVIEAEDYDAGGEGVGFHRASTRSAPNAYRSDAMDIGPASEGGYSVTLASGDWLKYTAEVQATGMYTIEVRVAHTLGADPLFNISCDGLDVTGTMSVPFTAGPQNWVTLTRPVVNLTAGKHVFTVKQVGGTPFYFNWMKFYRGTLPQLGPKPDAKDWVLVWSDEFNYSGKPDPEKWNYDLGGGGWGNDELEFYTDRLENARVENGRLILEARREEYQGLRYTSARLVTRGKQDFKYGRFVIRAKMALDVGTWPAIWLLGSNGKPWPANGELDIVEHIANNPGWIHGSAHSQAYFFKNGNQKTGIAYYPDAQTAFHEYALEWFPDHIDFFVDNNKYLTVLNEGTGWQAWPFDDPEYLVLNVALGGWGGPVDDPSLPARMEIDYVRVYRHK